MDKSQNSLNSIEIRRQRINGIRNNLKQIPLLNRTKELISKKIQLSNSVKQKQSPEEIQQFLSQYQCSLQQVNIHYTSKSAPSSSSNSFQDNYRIQEKIGQGAHGVVKRCVSIKNKKYYAVKILRMDDQHIKCLKKNFVNIESLEHPSIIKYKAIYFSQKKSLCYLLMQYFPYPNLLEIEIPSVEEFKKIIKKIIETIIYLHKNKICHRDIKPENILYDKKNGILKLIDFGISKCTFQRGCKVNMLTHTGTLYYKAPQMFLGGGYDQKIDNWALGVTIYKLITGKTPFESIYHNQTIKNILNGQILFQNQKWQKYGFLKDLTSRLLKKVQQRLRSQQAIKHIWFDSDLTNKKDMITSHISFEKDNLFGSMQQFLKNKSQNMKGIKNGKLKKQMKMQSWLKENKCQKLDLTESIELNEF